MSLLVDCHVEWCVDGTEQRSAAHGGESEPGAKLLCVAVHESNPLVPEEEIERADGDEDGHGREGDENPGPLPVE